MSLYDAFISYSHAKDKPIASALQLVVQKLGKPWYKRRALRVFRDDTSLSATPHLWPSIEKALSQSNYLILFASPESATSRWVIRETEYWLEHRAPETLLIGLTAGELFWNDQANDFDWSPETPIPRVLKGRFCSEPKWIDLRAYRDGVNPRDMRFTELAADFAAAIHGMPKEDLLSQEVRQQRRALTLALSASASLLVLVAATVWQWTTAEAEKARAEAAAVEAREQRDRAEHALDAATQTANRLIFDLARELRFSTADTLPLAKDILETVRKLQRELSRGESARPDLLHSRAGALDELAQTLLALGDTQGAVGAASEAKSIQQKLVQLEPKNASWKYNLTISYGSLGMALKRQGRLEEALAAYKQALVIADRLAKANPSNIQVQKTASKFEFAVGDILRMQGKFKEALTAFQQSLDGFMRLTEADANNIYLKRDLFLIREKIGDVLRSQGDLGAALKAYEDSLEVFKPLAEADLRNSEWQRDLFIYYDDVADVLVMQGDLTVELRGDVTAALRAYQDSVDIRERLAGADPKNAEWQRDLAVSRSRVASVLMEKGEAARALDEYRQARAIIAGLIEQSPDDASLANELAKYDAEISELENAAASETNALP